MDQEPLPDNPTIAEIMTTELVTTTPDRPVEAVARLLRARGLSGLPVVDAAGHLVGIVSELDVISKSGQTVEDIMTTAVISVSDEMGAAEVTALMGHHGIRRVPVVRAGRLVGIVTRSDLLGLFTLIRWTCAACGHHERGFTRPVRCVRCGGTAFHLEQERRTTEGF